MVMFLRPAVATAVVLLGLAFGCGGSSEVSEASCSACGTASYSAAQCEAWGEASGCETSSFVPDALSGGCANGCSFKNCDEPPSCGESAFPGDPPEPAADAATDPRCESSDDGLFASNPPCNDADEFSLNGVTYHYCPCSSSCPCGYTCGSIPLSVGGVIGSACAPQ